MLLECNIYFILHHIYICTEEKPLAFENSTYQKYKYCSHETKIEITYQHIFIKLQDNIQNS